ncbi:MAG TPA: Glu/Leu/Phe/Val dehydrogenase family protein, partial [Ignavibacteriales bacterium]|nr:Glu/Leu/Phe/Val dehydrogenase family protein [Ignavibacteriales bacterium]
EKIKRALETVKATVVKPEDIYDVDAEIFAPTALGAIINDKTIPKFKFQIIAGGANNQLEDEDKHGKALLDKGIIYAPDYVINAGGLINVANELEGYRQDRAMKQAEGIYDSIARILQISKNEKIPAHSASNKIAEERIKQIGKLKQIYSGSSNFSGRLGELAKR